MTGEAHAHASYTSMSGKSAGLIFAVYRPDQKLAISLRGLQRAQVLKEVQLSAPGRALTSQ
jgi:hypothetical protein